MDIEGRLKELLQEIDEEADVKSMSLDSLLKEDLGLSSVALLYMAVSLEQEFGIDFTKIDMEHVKTVGDVINIIESEGK